MYIRRIITGFNSKKAACRLSLPLLNFIRVKSARESIKKGILLFAQQISASQLIYLPLARGLQTLLHPRLKFDDGSHQHFIIASFDQSRCF
jgi:hypothetical protein